MQDLTQKFISPEEGAKIRAAVRDAERRTAGEIVPMIVTASCHYPMADVLGAVSLALPTALLATHLLGGVFWFGPDNLWAFLVSFALLFGVLQRVVRRAPALKRLFVSPRESDAEVEAAAFSAFYREGLHRTRDATGILVFVSIFERKVWVLADQGIDAKVAPRTWDGIVARIVAGIRRGRQCEALCQAIAEIADILKIHFPARPDDTDELENLIVAGTPPGPRET